MGPPPETNAMLFRTLTMKTNSARLLSYRSAMQPFVAGPEWKEFVLPFTTFGADGSGIMGIAWTAGPKIGTFELRLDNVRLE